MVDTNSDVAEQLTYYRAVANEYEQHTIDVPGQDELLAAINAFTPTGDVLELACGTGVWTEKLVESAGHLTAVDGAPEMLVRAQHRLGERSAVDFVLADLFSWQPSRRYDAVFFGFWISHVPAERFDAFWNLIDDCLAPGGSVFFFDDNHRTSAELIEGDASPIVQRHVNNGSQFRVIKIPYKANELEARLKRLGWNFSVTATAGPFYWAVGGRANRPAARSSA